MPQTLVNCPHCGKTYQVQDNALGRKATCSACRKPFILGAESSGSVQAGVPKVGTASRAAPSAGTTAGKSTAGQPPRGPTDAVEPGKQSGEAAAMRPPTRTGSVSPSPNQRPSTARPSTANLDRFEVIEELGAGAFGTVYKARDTQLDRLVALKIPRLGALGSKADVHRFLREARAAGSLRHPNIVPVYDAGEAAGSYFIASAYIEGQSLDEQMASGPQFSQQQAAQLIRTLAEALHYAHGHGIVHRDVKPPNVMIDTEGQPLLMDFGVARRTEGETLLTQEGARIGTPAYMSPEQHAGHSHSADARSDQWALGVLLYELLTGCRPFRAPSELQIGYAVRQMEPDRPRKIKKTVARDMETICLKCLEKDPDDRYASCQDLADDLGRWLAGESIAARRPDVVERGWRWALRHRVQCGFAAMALFLGLVVIVLFGVLSKPPELRLAPIPDHRILTNEEFRVRARLTDPGKWAGRARFELGDGAPEGARLDQDSGQVSFLASQSGVFPFTIRAQSLRKPSRRDETSFLVTVCDPVPAPMLAAIEGQRVEPGGELRLRAVVTNREQIPCDLRFEAKSGLYAGASIDPNTGEYVWKVPSDQRHGLCTVTICATADWPGEPSATTTFTVRVMEDTSIPLLTLEPIDARIARPGETVKLRVRATDHRQPPRQLSFTLVDPPSAATIDSESGEFSWTPGDADIGQERSVRIRVTTAAPERLVEETTVAIKVERPPPPKPQPEQGKPEAVQPSLVLAPPSEPRLLTGHAGRIRALCFSPDSRHLVSSASGEKFLRYWDVGSRNEVRTFSHGEDHGLACLVFSPSGRELAGAGRQLSVWRTDSRRPQYQVDRLNSTALAFSQDGRLIFVSTENSLIHIYNANHGKQVGKLQPTGYIAEFCSMAVSPNGQLLAVNVIQVSNPTEVDGAITGGLAAAIHVFHLTSGRETARLWLKEEVLSNSLVFDKDGQHVLFASDNPNEPVRRWRIGSSKAEPMFEPGLRFAFDRKQELLAIVEGHSILLRKTDQDQLLNRWKEGGKGSLSIALSPDGKYLATVQGDDPVIRVYDLSVRP